MASEAERWGRGLAKEFFAQGGFTDHRIISVFKGQFLRLLEKSSNDERRVPQDWDRLALASLVLLEADATDDEIMTLLQYVGRLRQQTPLEEQPSQPEIFWFSKLLITLIDIKWQYKPGTVWDVASSLLDDAVVDCAKEAFNKPIDISDTDRFLDNLASRNKFRFGDPLLLDSLAGLRRFLQMLSDDGSPTASYLLVLLGVKRDGVSTLAEELKRISDEVAHVCQLATLHLGLVCSQDKSTAGESERAFKAALYDFEREDGLILPELYEAIREKARKALANLPDVKSTASSSSSVNLPELVDGQIYRIQCCIEECLHVARGSDWEIMLPIWVSALAVEGGKLVEALWKCSLISSIRNNEGLPHVADILAKTKKIMTSESEGATVPKSDEGFVRVLHSESGHGPGCEQACHAHLLSLLKLWRAEKKSMGVIDFLGSGGKATKVDKINMLYSSPEHALHEKVADYPTLLLANILAVPFDTGHPLGQLPLRGDDSLDDGLKRFQRTFGLRNDYAHYRLYSGKQEIHANFEVVRSSAEKSIVFAKVLRTYL